MKSHFIGTSFRCCLSKLLGNQRPEMYILDNLNTLYKSRIRQDNVLWIHESRKWKLTSKISVAQVITRFSFLHVWYEDKSCHIVFFLDCDSFINVI